ncbi:MAG: hypothetical protein BWK76_25080 [Desulfobulbaceae bacterium A2]|nr:MAG: hypothetical protein BWK76_25080 [Desulfobulbaceae bacterium A2]
MEAGALLKLPVVLALVPYSKTTLYAKIKLGEFPKPVKLGLRAVAWPSAVIQEFIAGLELGR